MIRPITFSLPPSRAALGMRWLVLIVIMFGTAASSVGFTISHGLAAIATTYQLTPSSGDTSHDHSHGDHDKELLALDGSTSTNHPHHFSDHSHDKAHALPVAWGSPLPQLPSWRVRVRPWVEMVQAFRPERPPMG